MMGKNYCAFYLLLALLATPLGAYGSCTSGTDERSICTPFELILFTASGIVIAIGLVIATRCLCCRRRRRREVMMMKQGIEVRRSMRRNYGFLLEQVRRDVQCWQGELEEARRREREELEQCPPPYASHPRDRRCFEQAREDAPGGVEVVVVAPNPSGQMPQPGGVVAGEELQELEVTVPVVSAADVPNSASEADAGERAEPSSLPRSPTRAAQKQRECRRVREGASISSSSSAGLSGTDSAVIRYPPPSYSP